MADQESTATEQPHTECGALAIQACQEIEQLLRVLGTMKIDEFSDLAVRGIALRINALNHVAWSRLDGEMNADTARKTLYGHNGWFSQA